MTLGKDAMINGPNRFVVYNRVYYLQIDLLIKCLALR